MRDFGIHLTSGSQTIQLRLLDALKVVNSEQRLSVAGTDLRRVKSDPRKGKVVEGGSDARCSSASPTLCPSLNGKFESGFRGWTNLACASLHPP